MHFLPFGKASALEVGLTRQVSKVVVRCSKHPVPIILCNYDGFYAGLMHFLKACDTNGTVGAPELHNVLIANDNNEARNIPLVSARVKRTVGRMTLVCVGISFFNKPQCVRGSREPSWGIIDAIACWLAETL